MCVRLSAGCLGRGTLPAVGQPAGQSGHMQEIISFLYLSEASLLHSPELRSGQKVGKPLFPFWHGWIYPVVFRQMRRKQKCLLTWTPLGFFWPGYTEWCWEGVNWCQDHGKWHRGLTSGIYQPWSNSNPLPLSPWSIFLTPLSSRSQGKKSLLLRSLRSEMSNWEEQSPTDSWRVQPA